MASNRQGASLRWAGQQFYSLEEDQWRRGYVLGYIDGIIYLLYDDDSQLTELEEGQAEGEGFFVEYKLVWAMRDSEGQKGWFPARLFRNAAPHAPGTKEWNDVLVEYFGTDTPNFLPLGEIDNSFVTGEEHDGELCNDPTISLALEHARQLQDTLGAEEMLFSEEGSMLAHRIRVYWPPRECYYYGRVFAQRPETHEVNASFEIGPDQWLNPFDVLMEDLPEEGPRRRGRGAPPPPEPPVRDVIAKKCVAYELFEDEYEQIRKRFGKKSLKRPKPKSKPLDADIVTGNSKAESAKEESKPHSKANRKKGRQDTEGKSSSGAEDEQEKLANQILPPRKAAIKSQQKQNAMHDNHDLDYMPSKKSSSKKKPSAKGNAVNNHRSDHDEKISDKQIVEFAVTALQEHEGTAMSAQQIISYLQLEELIDKGDIKAGRMAEVLRYEMAKHGGKKCPFENAGRNSFVLKPAEDGDEEEDVVVPQKPTANRSKSKSKSKPAVQEEEEDVDVMDTEPPPAAKQATQNHGKKRPAAQAKEQPAAKATKKAKNSGVDAAAGAAAGAAAAAAAAAAASFNSSNLPPPQLSAKRPSPAAKAAAAAKANAAKAAATKANAAKAAAAKAAAAKAAAAKAAAAKAAAAKVAAAKAGGGKATGGKGSGKKGNNAGTKQEMDPAQAAAEAARAMAMAQFAPSAGMAAGGQWGPRGPYPHPGSEAYMAAAAAGMAARPGMPPYGHPGGPPQSMTPNSFAQQAAIAAQKNAINAIKKANSAKKSAAQAKSGNAAAAAAAVTKAGAVGDNKAETKPGDKPPTPPSAREIAAKTERTSVNKTPAMRNSSGQPVAKGPPQKSDNKSPRMEGSLTGHPGMAGGMPPPGYGYRPPMGPPGQNYPAPYNMMPYGHPMMAPNYPGGAPPLHYSQAGPHPYGYGGPAPGMMGYGGHPSAAYMAYGGPRPRGSDSRSEPPRPSSGSDKDQKTAVAKSEGAGSEDNSPKPTQTLKPPTQGNGTSTRGSGSYSGSYEGNRSSGYDYQSQQQPQQQQQQHAARPAFGSTQPDPELPSMMAWVMGHPDVSAEYKTMLKQMAPDMQSTYCRMLIKQLSGEGPPSGFAAAMPPASKGAYSRAPPPTQASNYPVGSQQGAYADSSPNPPPQQGPPPQQQPSATRGSTGSTGSGPPQQQPQQPYQERGRSPYQLPQYQQAPPSGPPSQGYAPPPQQQSSQMAQGNPPPQTQGNAGAGASSDLSRGAPVVTQFPGQSMAMPPKQQQSAPSPMPQPQPQQQQQQQQQATARLPDPLTSTPSKD
eukprot:Clim_evm33s150 gene=Clim_evmTU33s150